MKRVAILQSNYLPWKGYFDLIGSVDAFVFYDCMQYTRRDWRNRNRIKTANGLQWLTVPVSVKGRYHQTIRETQIEGSVWIREHLQAIRLNYAKSPHFEVLFPWLQALLESSLGQLSSLNQGLIREISGYLGIKTVFYDSDQFDLVEGKTERLLNLCQQVEAKAYVSGPSARGYLDESLFERQGIRVEWFDYDGYPEYRQNWGNFVHEVSILDLLLNVGPDAPLFMKIGQTRQ